MGRDDEGFDRHFAKSVELGEANAKCIEEMHRWCKHFRVEMQASGLFAQMASLPIGLHKIDCPYAKTSTGSANLTWICTDFLIRECAKCPHQSPTSDDSWGKGIIAEHERRERERAEEAARRQETIARLRESLRDQSQTIGQTAGPQAQRIVEFFEGLFAEDPVHRKESVNNLKQAAKVGADLFPDAAIELLLTLTLNDQFDDAALAVCRNLAGRHPDLNEKLLDAAVNVIRKKGDCRSAAKILVRLGDSVKYPLDAECIERLTLTQHHDVPIGGWRGRPPNYASSTEVVARCYDAQPESVLDVVRRNLQSEYDYLRKQICGALLLLQKKRPAAVEALLPDLLASLELREEEDITFGTPSGRIVHVLQAAFRQAPDAVDAALAAAIVRVRPAVQEDIAHIYRDQFFDRDVHWSQRHERRHTDDVSHAEQVAIKRLLLWVQEESFEPEIRHELADALENACSYATGEMVKHFDTILGYYALLCDRPDPPPAVPKILLPGQSEDPMLARMTDMGRRQQWGFFKQSLVQCLEELCKERPHEVFESVYGCLNQPTPQLGDEFRGSVVRLLGELGGHFEFQQRALPVLMRELMNYGSAWVRAKAIEATVEIFYSEPPENIVDTILVHLRDPYLVVHKAAVRAVDDRPTWFTKQQAVEAFRLLSNLAQHYRTDPYEVERVCQAVLALAGCHPFLKKYAVAVVGSIFPTSERHVDKKLAVELTRVIDSTDESAARVARYLATYLAMHDRDRLNSYSHDRRQMFNWLHNLPPAVFASVAADLFEQAKKLAARDFWESWHFASLFSYFGFYGYEREVLTTIRDAYPPEPRLDEARTTMAAVADVVSAIEQLSLGNSEDANRSFESARRAQS